MTLQTSQPNRLKDLLILDIRVMDRKKTYSAKDQYDYFVLMKNDFTRCEVCDRDIKTLQLKKHKDTYGHFSNATLKGVPRNYHFLKGDSTTTA